MRGFAVITGLCTALFYAAAISPASPLKQPEIKTSPLILEKNQGERRVMRPWPGHPEPGETIILKVDPKNGGSSHLVFMTGDLAPGGEISSHKHPGADELLFLQTGTARVHLGDLVREVHAGATILIPADTWISLSNIGKETISFTATFSAPGFEDYMRDVSALEGQPALPMTEAEDKATAQKHTHAVIYQ